MGNPSIYTVPYQKNKSYTEYLLDIEKAILSKSEFFQIEWGLSNCAFFNLFIEAIRDAHLKVCIKCFASDTKNIIQYGADGFILHIFVSNEQDLRPHISDLQQLKTPHVFILAGNRDTNFIETIRLFQNHLNVFPNFYFASFDKTDKKSLGVRGVASSIRKIEKFFPGFLVRPLPGLDLQDHFLISKFESEPLVTKPNFEIRLPSNSVMFSFIIPTYNNKYFLINVLKHIFAQTYPKENFEILIVDDGGTDNTLEFMTSYLGSEDIKVNLRYFYWPKPSVAEGEPPCFRAGLCRNVGANNALGEHLIFLDSDILLPPGFLVELRNLFLSQDVIQYVRHHVLPEKSDSCVSFADLDLKKDAFIEEKDYWRPFFEHPNWVEMPFYWKYACTYCLAMGKNNFFKAGRFRKSFLSYGFEDTDLAYRLHQMGLRFYLSKTVTLHLTDSSESSKHSGRTIRRFIALSKTAKIFFLANLDLDIYHHFESFMGGEDSFLKDFNYALGKFLKRVSRFSKKAESQRR